MSLRSRLRDLLFGDVLPPLSIGDAAFADWLRSSGIPAGDLGERGILGLTAVWRAQNLIAGTVAGLPFRVYQRDPIGDRNQVPHFLSSATPAGPYDLSAYSFRQMQMLHLLNHGEAFLLDLHNAAGEVIGFWPVHPSAVTNVAWAGGTGPGKVFSINGAGTFYSPGAGPDDSRVIRQIMGFTLDGLRGVSPLQAFRSVFDTTKAGDRAAKRSFDAPLIGGLVTTAEDVDEEEAKVIKAKLDARINGVEHAGEIAVVNRSLEFSPWGMNNEDAQFIASRDFQIEEVSRIYGPPPHLLSSTSKVTSWGSGIAELTLGFAKFTLMSWTSLIESTYARFLEPQRLFGEHDFGGLLQGAPADVIKLLLAETGRPLMTLNEGRAKLNLPSVAGGDVILDKPLDAPVTMAALS